MSRRDRGGTKDGFTSCSASHVIHEALYTSLLVATILSCTPFTPSLHPALVHTKKQNPAKTPCFCHFKNARSAFGDTPESAVHVVVIDFVVFLFEQINFREEAGPCEYIVWYCRMLTSGFLKLNAARYRTLNFMALFAHLKMCHPSRYIPENDLYHELGDQLGNLHRLFCSKWFATAVFLRTALCYDCTLGILVSVTPGIIRITNTPMLDRFLPFLEHTVDMHDFCQREVEPMGKECEQVNTCK